MKNAAEKEQGKPTQEYPEAQTSELGEEVEIFRAIAQEYFYEDSDEKMEIITWENNTTEPIWWENENELMNADEYMTQEWEEELINSELERAINYQNLLLELDREAHREIT
ncbi:9403_t:CDS:1 [Dentiscutata erythropus]|uniref:9403_t:CDS:1 n=1 Tax=Dentiscutata erythropus TaxID=1348616 RepID=A0A9N9GDG0_9GLOM|nr:9403_t:CDS:1 [Dentiscutata erythropus]